MSSITKSPLPDGWQVKKTAWLFNLIASGSTPPSNKEEYYQKDIAWLNTGDLTDGYVESPSKFISKKALEDFSTLKIYPENSLVIAMYGATIGKLGITKFETTTNQACCVLSQPNNVDMKFMFYWLRGHREQIIQMSQGGGQPNISQGIIRSIRVAVPNLDMQKNIVKFLDIKFEELNRLIVDKEKSIQLLEEKRHAMITEAVTKGLNPNVTMKDSGVEWIGKIPEHWEIKKIKNVADIYPSNVDKKSVEGEYEVLLCNYVDVYYNDEITKEIEFMKATAKPEQIEKFTLQQNDVIVTKDSESPIDIAIPTWVSENLDGVLCGYHLALLRSNGSELNGLFLYYSLESVSIREQFYSRANGVTRFGLGKESIKNGVIACPPLNEQQDITQHLGVLNQEIKSIKSKVQQQIQKLKEYRQSLIYEAVTGKIDVRDFEVIQ